MTKKIKYIDKYDILRFILAFIAFAMMLNHIISSKYDAVKWLLIYMLPIVIAFHFLQLYKINLMLKFFIDFLFWIIYSISSYFVEDYLNDKMKLADFYVCNAVVKNKDYHSSTNKPNYYYIDYESVTCKNKYNGRSQIYKSFYDGIKKGDTILIKYITECNKDDVYNYHPNKMLLKVFKFPVLFKNNIEFGNDYYYYAKLRPDLALKNFGLKIIYCSKDGEKLLYKNINRDLDSGLYYSKDLHTKENFAKIGNDTMFYFHGEIIPKEQLFSEVPQAKEYYEKYNKN